MCQTYLHGYCRLRVERVEPAMCVMDVMFARPTRCGDGVGLDLPSPHTTPHPVLMPARSNIHRLRFIIMCPCSKFIATRIFQIYVIVTSLRLLQAGRRH